MIQAVLDYLNNPAHAQQALERLKEYLSIPSVSAQPAHQSDVRRAADWTCDHLRQSGLEAQVLSTAGHPVVLAHTKPEDVLTSSTDGKTSEGLGGNLGGRTGGGIGRGIGGGIGGGGVLFYGHYDVQPPEPMELWQSPPFVPTVRNGALYARGSSDDKGQVACFLEALRAWKVVHGKFPVPVTVLIEGEEEIGSVNLAPFLEQYRSQLQADIVLVSDTAMWKPGVPAIMYGLRGLQYFDIQLHHANRDLHSGLYGGVAANPATMLAQVLGRLFDADHRVTIPGFYDDVPRKVSDQEKERWESLGFDEQADYLSPIGVTEPFGEKGYSTLERRWSRPACDVNGLYGGYGGPGAKTVIPSFAGAKVSFRLAPNQKAEKIAKAFVDWLHTQPVHGCRWQITDLGGSDPVMLPVDSPFIAAAQRAIQRSSGCLPVLARDGATIPVIASFKNLLGLESLLVGFGLSDDCLHAPNEKFDLDCFHLGCRTHAAILDELAHRKR